MRLKTDVAGANMIGMNHLRVLRNLNSEDVRLVGFALTYEPNLKQAAGFLAAIIAPMTIVDGVCLVRREPRGAIGDHL